MTHWRKPLYTIETEFGTLYSVEEKEADAIADYLQSAAEPMKFTRHQESRLPDLAYIAGMVLAVSMIITGLAYLFRG